MDGGIFSAVFSYVQKIKRLKANGFKTKKTAIVKTAAHNLITHCRKAKS